MHIFLWIIQLIIVPLCSPLVIGLTRTIKARLQNRRGASPLQPYRDLWKLFHKGEVISADASWIFRAAPFVIFTVTVAIAISIPIFSLVTSNVWMSDLLVFVGPLALEAFVLALAGMDTGSPFGGFGSSRQMMMVAFTEGGLVLSLCTLAFINHTTNLFTISSQMLHGHFVSIASIILCAIAFGIAMLSETMRYPFDNPATHLELTMIHEAMILEYSGPRLALMEWAAANKYLIFIIISANLFVPFGIASVTTFSALVIGVLVLVSKVVVVSTGIAMLESSVAKLRIFRLPDLLFTSFILSVIAIGLAL